MRHKRLTDQTRRENKRNAEWHRMYADKRYLMLDGPGAQLQYLREVHLKHFRKQGMLISSVKK